MRLFKTCFINTAQVKCIIVFGNFQRPSCKEYSREAADKQPQVLKKYVQCKCNGVGEPAGHQYDNFSISSCYHSDYNPLVSNWTRFDENDINIFLILLPCESVGTIVVSNNKNYHCSNVHKKRSRLNENQSCYLISLSNVLEVTIFFIHGYHRGLCFQSRYNLNVFFQFFFT